MVKVTLVPEAQLVIESTDGYVTLQVTSWPILSKKVMTAVAVHGSEIKVHREGFWWWITADGSEIMRGRSIWRSIDIVVDDEDFIFTLSTGQSLYRGDPGFTVHMGWE